MRSPQLEACADPEVVSALQVAFAPVGSEVFDEELGAGTTTIKPVKLKGVNSAGMLCSGKLLGLTEEDGVALVFPAVTPVGMDAGEAFVRIVQPDLMDEGKKALEMKRKKEEEAQAASKAKAEAKKAAKAAEAPKEEAPAKEEKDGKKGKKVNEQVARMQEIKRRLKEEEDRIQALEDARKAREAEELRLIAEEEAAAGASRISHFPTLYGFFAFTAETVSSR